MTGSEFKDLLETATSAIAIIYFIWKLMALSKGQGRMEEKIHQLERSKETIAVDINDSNERITTESIRCDNQFNKIYDRLNASDSRVSGIESTVKSIQDGQVRIESKLDRLIERLGDK